MSRCTSCESRQRTPDFERSYQANPFEIAPGEYGRTWYGPLNRYTFVTPFSRPFWPDVVGTPVTLPRDGYRPYDLFALRTRLYPLLSRLREELGRPGLGISFISIPLNGAMRIIADFTDGGVSLNKDDEELDEEVIQSEIDKVAGFLPNYCLLMSPLPLLCQKSPYTMPEGWVRSILPYLAFPSTYYVQIREEGLYIQMSGKDDYVDEYNVLYLQTRRILETLYSRGVLVLSPTLDATVIRDWSLIPLPLTNPEALAPLYAASPSEVGQGGRGVTQRKERTYGHENDRKELEGLLALEQPETREQKLYVPDWFDSRFAPDPTAFLQKLLYQDATPEIRVPMGGFNMVRRHRIASLLSEMGVASSRVEFHREYVYVRVKNKQEATEICDRIFALPTPPGRIIAAIPTYRAPSTQTLERDLPDLERVQYRTTDYNNRPALLSLLCPPPSEGIVETQKLYNGQVSFPISI